MEQQRGRDVDLVTGKRLDEFPRRAFQARKSSRDLLSHVGFNLVDQPGQDLVDE
jgi:hypothetical protein